MTITLKINNFRKLISEIQQEIYDLGDLLSKKSTLTLEDIRPLQEKLLTVGNREYKIILDEIYFLQTLNEKAILEAANSFSLMISNTNMYLDYKCELHNTENYIETVVIDNSTLLKLCSLKNKLHNIYYYKDELSTKSGLAILSDHPYIIMQGNHYRPNSLKIDHECRTMTFCGGQWI